MVQTLKSTYYDYFQELSDATRGLSSLKRELILLCIAVLCFIFIINSSWKASPDSALYLELGESMAHGTGYKFNGEHHTYVPPGYPFLVSVTVKLFGNSFLAFRVMMSIVGIATGFCGYLLILRLLGRDLALVIGGLFAVNNTLLLNSTYTTSDTLFTLFGLLSLISVSAIRSGSTRPCGFTLAGALSGIPALVRINGWGLPVSSGLFLFSSMKKSALTKRVSFAFIFVIAALIVPCLWEVHKIGYPASINEGEYVKAVTGRTLGTQLAIISKAAWDYIPEMATAFAGVSIKTGSLEILIALLTVIGFWVSWKRGERLFTYLTVVQFGGLLLSPAGARYLLLLIPGLLLFFFQGVAITTIQLDKRTSIKWRKIFELRGILVVVSFLLFATNMGQNFVTIFQARWALEYNGAESDRDKPFFVAARWLRANADGEPVLTMNPRIIRYLTGLPTVETLRSGSPEETVWPSTRNQIATMLEKRKPAFLFLDDKDPALKKLIIEAAESLDLRVDVIPGASFGNRYSVARLSPRN